MSKKIIFITVCLLFIFSIEKVFGCMVPVFRYGLETWIPDDYELIVFHKGSFTEKDKLLFKYLKQLKTKDYANISVTEIDLSGSIPAKYKNLEKDLDVSELPIMAVKYPLSCRSYKGSIWTGRFTEDNINKIVFSPARTEIGKRILGGDALVWVIVESGNEEKDADAVKKLSEQLKILNKSLKLSPNLESIAKVCKLDISFNFSMIRISRNDPAEKVFIDMLMYFEPGLFELESSPMVFPVFVRGRVLSPLVGKGIKEKFIKETCKFVIDACGCEIKDENPGVDLLMAVNWDAGLGKRWVDEEIPLVGTAPLAEIAADDYLDSDINMDSDIKDVQITEPVNKKKSGKLLFNLSITFAVVIVIIIILSLIISRLKKKR